MVRIRVRVKLYVIELHWPYIIYVVKLGLG